MPKTTNSQEMGQTHPNREHLKNCHNITFYCGRCGVHVEDVGVHIANGCPAEGYLIRAVTAETTEKLKDRKLPYKCGGDEAVKWTQYWKILFPGVETRSPCKSPSSIKFTYYWCPVGWRHLTGNNSVGRRDYLTTFATRRRFPHTNVHPVVPRYELSRGYE